MKTEVAWWLAALIDGEGSIMLIKRKPRAETHRSLYRPIISVANTDYRLMTALIETIGCGQIYEHRVSNTMKSFNPRKRQQWTWRLNADQIRAVLPEVRPFLVLKREQADLLLEALAIKTLLDARRVDYRTNPPEDRRMLRSRTEAIYAEIRALNTRGREVPLVEMGGDAE